MGSIQEATQPLPAVPFVDTRLLAAKSGGPTRSHLLAANYFGLGDVELENLETDKALENFRTAIQILGDDLNGNGDHDLWLARFHVLMGSTLNELGLQTESLVSFRRAIAIAEDLAQKSPASKPAKRTYSSLIHNIIRPLAGEETLNVGDFESGPNVRPEGSCDGRRLAASDSKNEQARSDLAFAYLGMGNAFRLTQPAIAGAWYRKSISLTQELAHAPEAQHSLASREEALAAVLVKKEQATERLHLLQDANALRQKLAKTEPDLPTHRQSMMRSYCRLIDAELAAK